MSDAARTFILEPHATTPERAIARIHGRIARSPTGLAVTWLIEGDLPRLTIPPSRSACFADELWRHTCVELFVARKGGPGYLEFNFSPSSEWAIYAFSRYRERVALERAAVARSEPQIVVERTSGQIQVSAFAAIEQLAPDWAHAPLAVGLSAVIENSDGAISYWALHHPSAKPDFHPADAFVLEFDEIRN